MAWSPNSLFEVSCPILNYGRWSKWLALVWGSFPHWHKQKLGWRSGRGSLVEMYTVYHWIIEMTLGENLKFPETSSFWSCLPALQRGQIVFARHYRLQYTPSVHSRIDKFPTNKGVPPFTALNLLCGLALGIVESCHSAGESRWGTAASHLVESHWFVGGGSFKQQCGCPCVCHSIYYGNYENMMK